MWDLKLCGGIFVSFLLFYLLMHFNLIFTLDPFSNDTVHLYMNSQTYYVCVSNGVGKARLP